VEYWIHCVGHLVRCWLGINLFACNWSQTLHYGIATFHDKLCFFGAKKVKTQPQQNKEALIKILVKPRTFKINNLEFGLLFCILSSIITSIILTK